MTNVRRGTLFPRARGGTAVALAWAIASASMMGCGDGEAFVVAPTADVGGDETSTSDAAAEGDGARDDGSSDASDGRDAMDARDAHEPTDAIDAGDAGDAHAEVSSDAPIDGLDVDVDAGCDAPVFCYRDGDADGYVVTDGAFVACGGCPVGARVADPATERLDCDDTNAMVHPGVTSYFTVAYCVGGSCAKKSFDYDCDGDETLEFSAIATSCAVAGSGCGGAGWVGVGAPGCGDAATWVTCTRDLLSCKASTSSVVQGCR